MPGYVGVAGTLHTGALSLASSSILDFNLNTPGAVAGGGGNSLLQVGGALSLGTGIALNVSTGTGWGPAGAYVLATCSSLTNNSSSFSGWTVSGIGQDGYSFSVSTTSLSLNVGATATWIGSSSGSWATSSYWQGGNVPNGALDAANFGSAIGSGSATVNLDASRTLYALTFSNTAGSYTLSRSTGDSSSFLTLSNSNGMVVSDTGNNTIAVPVTLAGNVSFSPTAGSTLTVSGAISQSPSGTSRTLTVSGGGTLVLSGSNTYTGATAVNSGNLAVNGSLSSSSNVTVSSSATLSGSGTVGGAVAVAGGGAVWPGYGGVFGTLHTGALSLANSSILDLTSTHPTPRPVPAATACSRSPAG